MTDIGDRFDSEPEDSWHPDDPIPELLDNLRRRIVLLALAGGDGQWGDRERIRSRDIDDDFLFLIERLRHEGFVGSG